MTSSPSYPSLANISPGKALWVLFLTMTNRSSVAQVHAAAHSSCEFLIAMFVPCLEDSVSQPSSLPSGSYSLSATSCLSFPEPRGSDRCERTLWGISNVLSLFILTKNCFVSAFLKTRMDLKTRSKMECEGKQANITGAAIGAWVSLNTSLVAYYDVPFFPSFKVFFVFSEIV